MHKTDKVFCKMRYIALKDNKKSLFFYSTLDWCNMRYCNLFNFLKSQFKKPAQAREMIAWKTKNVEKSSLKQSPMQAPTKLIY